MFAHEIGRTEYCLQGRGAQPRPPDRASITMSWAAARYVGLITPTAARPNTVAIHPLTLQGRICRSCGLVAQSDNCLHLH